MTLPPPGRPRVPCRCRTGKGTSSVPLPNREGHEFHSCQLRRSPRLRLQPLRADTAACPTLNVALYAAKLPTGKATTPTRADAEPGRARVPLVPVAETATEAALAAEADTAASPTRNVALYAAKPPPERPQVRLVTLPPPGRARVPCRCRTRKGTSSMPMPNQKGHEFHADAEPGRARVPLVPIKTLPETAASAAGAIPLPAQITRFALLLQPSALWE